MEFGVSSNNFTGEDINYHWKEEINVIENVEKFEALRYSAVIREKI